MTHLAGPTDPSVVWDWFRGLSGGLAFDIGANGGGVSRILAENFVHVLALEPCEESFSDLVTDKPHNVTALNLAASAVTGYVDLDVAESAIGSGQLVSGDSLGFSWGAHMGTRTVPAVTLDDLVTTYGRPDFVKIDTEGHEVEVVTGGRRVFSLLMGKLPRVLIEVHAAEHEAPLSALLRDYNLQRIEHPGYPLGHPGRENHFFLRSAT